MTARRGVRPFPCGLVLISGSERKTLQALTSVSPHPLRLKLDCCVYLSLCSIVSCRMTDQPTIREQCPLVLSGLCVPSGVQASMTSVHRRRPGALYLFSFSRRLAPPLSFCLLAFMAVLSYCFASSCEASLLSPLQPPPIVLRRWFPQAAAAAAACGSRSIPRAADCRVLMMEVK